MKPFIIHRQDQDLLEKAADGVIVSERTTFLSPFDNLFWARGRDIQFWNFRNLLEAYKPEAKRIRGYFNMPILHKDRLVGRIDPKMDRKNGRLIVKSIYLEDGIEADEQLVADIIGAFRSFMIFHQADDIEIVSSQPADLEATILSGF